MAAVAISATQPIAVPTSGGAVGRTLVTVGRVLGRMLVSFGVVVGGWLLLLELWDVEDYLIRGPADVWRYLFTAPEAAAARSALLSDVWITLQDAAIGLFAGTASAFALALLFNRFKAIEQGFLPIALLVRTTPLVALAPLIALVFGRGVLGVAVVGGLITFFPTLVNVSLGLTQAPQQSIDLMEAYGASRLTTLLRLQIPTAMPGLFAALRSTVPLAITGALVAEWQTTGKGMGAVMNSARTLFDYDQMWAEVVTATLLSIILYSVTVGVEGAVLARFAPDRARAAKTGA